MSDMRLWARDMLATQALWKNKKREGTSCPSLHCREKTLIMFFRDEMSVDISAVHALTESKVLLALLKTPLPYDGLRRLSGFAVKRTPTRGSQETQFLADF